METTSGWFFKDVETKLDQGLGSTNFTSSIVKSFQTHLSESNYTSGRLLKAVRWIHLQEVNRANLFLSI